MRRASNWLGLAACLAAATAGAQSIDFSPLFTQAEQTGRVGLARKTQLVDARPTGQGEIVVTVIAGEAMVARPGDAIVRNPANPSDTYRIAAASFTCTYEIVTAP